MNWCILVHLVLRNALGSPFCRWPEQRLDIRFDDLLEKHLGFVFGWMSTFVSYNDTSLYLHGSQPKEEKELERFDLHLWKVTELKTKNLLIPAQSIFSTSSLQSN